MDEAFARPRSPVACRLRALRPTAAGTLLLVVAAALAASFADEGGAERRDTAARALHLVGAFAATSALITWLSIRRLRVSLELPRHGHANRPLAARLTVEQPALLPALALDALVRAGNGVDAALPPLPWVPPLGRTALEADLPMLARGFHDRLEVRLSSRALLLWEVVVAAELPVPLAIFPAVEVLERPALAPGSPVSPSGDAPLARPGHDSEFLGLRPYVPGDSPRLVHWPVSARTGRLHVRELVRLSTADVTLAVDLSGEHAPAAEEDLVSATASIALHLHLRSVPAALWVAAPEPKLLKAGNGRAHHDGLQAALTAVRGGGAPALLPLLRRRRPDLRAGELLLIVAMRPAFNRELRGWLDELQHAGTRAALVLLAPELYEPGAAPTPAVARDAPSGWSDGRLGRPSVYVPGRPLRLDEVLTRIG